jgi:hypothetical protein
MTRSATWRRAGWQSIVVASVVAIAQVASAHAADEMAQGMSGSQEPVITLELPHPGLLADRLTEPRIQQSLKLLPQYRKFLEGQQFREFKAVVAMVTGQLHTTWERALNDLAGGGLVVRVFAEPGGEPRIQAVMTAREKKVLERVNEIFLNLARQDAKNKKKPEPVRKTDYKGTVVYGLGGEGEKGLAYAIISGRLAVATSMKDLERVVDRLHADDRVAVGASRDKSAVGDDGSLVVRGHVELRRLESFDPKKFTLPAKPDAGVVFLFGSWYEALKRAPAIDLAVRWSETEFTAGLDVPLPKEARPASVKGYLPGQGEGTAAPLRPPGTIASLSLWRDWATIWESRAELFKPEVVQGFAQLDTLAGQFFGAREFGADVLGAFDPHWRLVVAQQDYAAMKPAPDQKLPAFAIVAELNASQEDFAERLKIAFQSFVALTNIDAAQKKAAVLELGSEELDGIRIATTRYVVARKPASAKEPGAQRYNYSPSAAQVGRYFILSSSAGLARTLVRELKSSGSSEKKKDEPTTMVVEADGPELARLLDQNRSRMVMQTMLERGETREGAEGRVALTLALFRYLGHGRLVVSDGADRTRVDLRLELAR